MRNVLTFIAVSAIFFACGGGGDKTESSAPGQVKMPATLAEAEANYKSYNGVGPIESFELTSEIDEALAAEGMEIYNTMCSACHKPDKKFIGPAPAGIFERRTPAWVMNMILNPEEMVQKDPIAKLLLIEYNMSPMANQNLTEEQARAVLEYFRTL